MADLTGGANLLSAVGGIVGGLTGRSNNTEQNIRLMASAARRYGQKYGFNPLTLLGASGGAVDQGGGNISSAAFLGEAIGSLADSYFNTPDEDGVEAERRKMMQEKAATEAAAKASNPYQDFGFSLPKVSAPLGPAVPVEGAFIGPRQLVKVRHAVTGNWLNMDPGVAARLKLSSGDTIMAEDYEAIYGDLISEVQGVASSATRPLAGGDRAMPNDPKRPIVKAPPLTWYDQNVQNAITPWSAW